jgi:gliding motility-associated-like protein
LIENREGISLERINYNQKTQDENNWHSAASSSGYGTPGYKNSQNISGEYLNLEVKILPEMITPNNDGKDDIASIQYSFSEPGNVATIIIFDASGRKIKTLQRSVICGISGSFMWNGLDDQNKKLPSGMYVVYVEVFNLKGVVRKFKKVVVVVN